MPSLNRPQAEFLTLERKYKLLVGGFGSGKTWAGCADHCRHAWELPQVGLGYFAPTYPMVRDIFYPTIDEVAHDWGLRTRINESRHEVHLYAGQVWRSTIICRSMENPGDIVGFKIGHAHVDEIDVMPPAKAVKAWRKIIARLRWNAPGVLNGASVTTTPEGYRFAYNTFVRDLDAQREKQAVYGLVRATTYENERYLPAGYIDGLRADYPPQLIEAYLNARFVNLASGSVYADFDRRQNHTDAVLDPAEPIHVGMDFNVLKMHASIGVVRNGEPIQVAELGKVRDTPTMARMLAERFGKTPAGDKRSIVVYPDASGRNTSSKGASESDLSILQQAGFTVRANPSNPAVKDRVNAVNAQILNDQGARRFRINTHACPLSTEALEQQPYDDNGEPDKSTDHDHPNDALGYWIAHSWPVQSRNLRRVKLTGH